MDKAKKSIILELAVVTAGILVVTRLLYLSQSLPFMKAILPLLVAVLFLYVPVMVMWKRKRRIEFLDHGASAYLRSFLTFMIASAIVFPIFFIAAHFWQLWVFDYAGFSAADFPDFLNVLVFQLFLIALPEEFYFRGYFQTMMDGLFEKRWRILGVRLGWGWIVTAFVFAIAHSIVTYRWWHFSIFFPALVFGYLKERTGTVTAPILFHTASNLFMNWFARSYF